MSWTEAKQYNYHVGTISAQEFPIFVSPNHSLESTRDPVQSSWMNDQAGRTMRRDFLLTLYDWDAGIAGDGLNPGVTARGCYISPPSDRGLESRYA
jgi:hypothetical protein